MDETQRLQWLAQIWEDRQRLADLIADAQRRHAVSEELDLRSLAHKMWQERMRLSR